MIGCKNLRKGDWISTGAKHLALLSIAKVSIQRRLPAALDHLKILELSYINISCSTHEVLLSISLICFSQNLQELHISANYDYVFNIEEPELDARRADCTLKHLHSI